MKTVEDISKIWKQKAAEAIYPGLKSNLVTFRTRPLSKAYRTGNLLRQFVAQNQKNTFKSVERNNETTYEMNLVIAPRGAFYGRFVHNGTVKMGARPFVQIAGDTQEVQSVIQDFMGSLAKTTLEDQTKEIKSILSPYKE